MVTESGGLRRQTQVYPDGVRGLVADLCNPDSLCDLPALDLVFYLPSADTGDDDGYRRAYVLGLTNLLTACRDAGQRLRRVFYVSSTSVYGQNDGAWVDETSTTVPRRDTARRLLEGEQIAASFGVAQTVVRFAGIYGPERYQLIRRVIEAPPSAISARSYTNRIHRDDCAGFLHHLTRCGELQGLYLGVDDEPATEGEVCAWLAARLQRPCPEDESGTDSPGWLNKRCANTRLRETGYQLQFPNYREGYRDVLQYYFADQPVWAQHESV